jgi:hypothetical protein
LTRKKKGKKKKKKKAALARSDHKAAQQPSQAFFSHLFFKTHFPHFTSKEK